MARRYTRKERLAILRRRRDFLAEKLPNIATETAATWYRQELAAVIWAIDILEAAIRMGTIDELERVAHGPTKDAAQ